MKQSTILWFSSTQLKPLRWVMLKFPRILTVLKQEQNPDQQKSKPVKFFNHSNFQKSIFYVMDSKARCDSGE